MAIQVPQEFSKHLKTPETKLIIGLGNVGDEYLKTRHNAGFLAVDHFVQAESAGTFTHKKDLFADVLESRIDGIKVVFVKPTTLMNLSGKAVLALQSYFKLDNRQLLVVHDDIDLEFGKVRTRVAGGNGGHNGIKSIDAAVGDDYMRLKIGVKNNLREQIDASDFVLQQFSKDEFLQLNHAWGMTSQLISDFLHDKLETTSISY